MKMTSTPTEFQADQLMEMSQKNPNFMKNIPKPDRMETFASWVHSEKTQYAVEGNFDLKSKKVPIFLTLVMRRPHDVH